MRVAIVDVLQDQPLADREPFYMNHGSFCYTIDGGYKLVTVDGKTWSLYNLEKEKTEITDLSNQEPEKAQELLGKYKAWVQSLKR